MRTLSLAIGICLALCSAAAVLAQADPTYVYFANGERIYRFDPDPVACVGNLSCIEEVLFLPGAELRGLNYGPDESLYWCDAATGRVGRWRLDASGTRVNEVFFTYPAADPNNPGPAQPRCGWFNHLGGFAVTDGANGGVWLFPDLADYERDFDDPGYDPNYTGAPVQILATGTAGLEGVTQYIDGDLLLVRPGAKKKGGPKGAVLCSEFDSFLPGSPPPLGPPPPCYPFGTLIADLSTPRGVAVADGYIFVTDDRRLQRFDSEGDLKSPTCADFGRNTPLLLAATVDGRLFVGTQSNRDGRIYRVDFDGTACGAPVLLQTLPKNLGYASAVTGVAVTQTHDTVTATVADPDEDGTYEAAFGFNGANVWELTAGQGCTASITGFLTPPARVQEAIDAIVVNDPNDPQPNPVDGFFVNFFGDNGNAHVWRLCGETADGATSCPDLTDTCPAGDGGFYRHLVTGYAPFLPNGRLGVCDPAAPPTPSFCELVELTISVSFNPDLAKVDPVGGRRGSGSDYYLLNVSTGNANVPGFFCGFQSPITEADPPAQFSIGDTIPVKFRLALLTFDQQGDPIYDCQNGPFITQEAIALLSVAQLEPFKVKKRIFANGAGQNEPAYFQGPLNPSQSFHYNLDTNGFNPGLHLLEVSFPYDTETVKQVLVEMVMP